MTKANGVSIKYINNGNISSTLYYYLLKNGCKVNVGDLVVAPTGLGNQIGIVTSDDSTFEVTQKTKLLLI